jgi:hypothetical protein
MSLELGLGWQDGVSILVICDDCSASQRVWGVLCHPGPSPWRPTDHRLARLVLAMSLRAFDFGAEVSASDSGRACSQPCEG